ncbi:MAG: hypothetical protein Q9163_005937 [Psora crenata]
MASSSEAIDVYIAVYTQGPMFKHWALFVDNNPNPIMLHAEGSEGNYRFEELKKDPRASKRPVELVKDYVVELIEKAIEEKMIKVTERKMAEIKGMIEGLA